jgi:hypothetical protein
MRPIYWGVIWFFIGMVGWISFSVIVGVGTALGGQAPGLLWTLVYLFGGLFYFSLPIAVVAEIIRWYRTRKHVKAPEAEPSRLGGARPVVYCHQCGRQMPSGSLYCDRCGTRL